MKLSLSAISTINASFAEDVPAYAAAGVDAIGLWEFKLPADDDANPGLRSRFPKTIEFPDYTTEELVGIFESIAEDAHYQLAEGGRAEVSAWLAAFPRGKGFGNGRLARNLFEDAVGRHATRVVTIEKPTDEQLCTLMPEDIAEPGEGPGHRPSPEDLVVDDGTSA